MNIAVSKYQERTYNESEVCFFRKTKELNGGLSNMAAGFPLQINNVKIYTSEALYQACRFPHLEDLQKQIINEKSPMSAKMVSKPFRISTRPDWDNIRTDIMYWCLRVKLAQNFNTFGRLLESTGNLSIVEESTKDDFWGAIRDKQDPQILKGVNALGRLLMKLRLEYNSSRRYDLLYVEPLTINDFFLYGQPIKAIDERKNFINSIFRINLVQPEVKIIETPVSILSNNTKTKTDKSIKKSINTPTSKKTSKKSLPLFA